MSGPVRRGGAFDEAGLHRTTTWSVAEGSKGRRWRWITHGRDDRTAHTLETALDGGFLGLESAAPGALLSLHIEPDGTIHGNRVHAGGVEHLAFPGGPSSVVAGRSPMAWAALMAGTRLAEAARVEHLRVDDGSLRVTPATVTVRPVGQRQVEIGDFVLELDEDGLPVVEGGRSWPLEVP